jgi:hypothetical protein
VGLRILVAAALLQSKSVYFVLLDILPMFKMVPDHIVCIFFFAVDHIYGINMEQLQLAFL